jgi:hypothetical protein
MHPNFYHWHARAEMKPETTVLEPRWNAAAKLAEKLSASDVRSLLLLVLFPGAEPDFAKRYTVELVKLEPTFLPTGNAELLRVMATAAIYSRMDKPSPAANAVALGLQAAAFPKARIEPVSQDVMTRASKYLSEECERIRPKIYAGVLERAEKQNDGLFAALKRASETNNPAELGKATESFGRGVLAAVKESHKQLGEVIGRLTEESQFLWWLIGRRSPFLNKRREELSAAAYCLPAAAEAAERVGLLPPAASVESLIDATLAQCTKGERDSTSLGDLISSADPTWVQRVAHTPEVSDLTPIASLLGASSQKGKLTAESLKRFGISARMKFSPFEVAEQYFRELMFIRALEQLS